MKCQGVSKKGHPCTNPAESDSGFCKHHANQASHKHSTSFQDTSSTPSKPFKPLPQVQAYFEAEAKIAKTLQEAERMADVVPGLVMECRKVVDQFHDLMNKLSGRSASAMELARMIQSQLKSMLELENTNVICIHSKNAELVESVRWIFCRWPKVFKLDPIHGESIKIEVIAMNVSGFPWRDFLKALVGETAPSTIAPKREDSVAVKVKLEDPHPESPFYLSFE